MHIYTYILRYYFRINVSHLLTKLIKLATLVIVMRLEFAAIHRYFPQKILWSPPKEFVSSCLPTYLVICSCCVCHSKSRAPASECNNSTKYYNISILPSLCTHLHTNTHTNTHKMCIHIAHIHNGKIREV